MVSGGEDFVMKEPTMTREEMLAMRKRFVDYLAHLDRQIEWAAAFEKLEADLEQYEVAVLEELLCK
ncbi:MAG: hypothetical protein WCD02_10495 [Terriglobales bacterium]